MTSAPGHPDRPMVHPNVSQVGVVQSFSQDKGRYLVAMVVGRGRGLTRGKEAAEAWLRPNNLQTHGIVHAEQDAERSVAETADDVRCIMAS